MRTPWLGKKTTKINNNKIKQLLSSCVITLAREENQQTFGDKLLFIIFYMRKTKNWDQFLHFLPYLICWQTRGAHIWWDHLSHVSSNKQGLIEPFCWCSPWKGPPRDYIAWEGFHFAGIIFCLFMRAEQAARLNWAIFLMFTLHRPTWPPNYTWEGSCFFLI